MKICHSCGAYNSDERMFCVDCNEMLDSRLSDEHQEEMENKIKSTTEKLYNRNDPLHISLYDKIVGIGCIAASALLLVLGFALMLKNRGEAYPFVLMLFGVVGSLEAFAAQMGWNLELMRLSIHYNNVDDLTPSSFYKFSRKFSETVCLIICIVGIVITLASVVHPPVVDYANTLYNYYNIERDLTVEDRVAENPEMWEEIIGGGNYTVKKYIKHLEGCHIISAREQLMIKAITEIKDLDLDYRYYTEANQFLEDYSNEINNRKMANKK